MYVLAPLRKKSTYAPAYIYGTSTCIYTVKGVEYIFDIFLFINVAYGRQLEHKRVGDRTG